MSVFHHKKLIQIIIIYIVELSAIGFSLKVDGFSEVTAAVGTKTSLPCNTSILSPDVSLVIWYRGITGKPLYTLDARRISSLVNSGDNGGQLDEIDDTRFTFDTSTEPASLLIDGVSEEDEGEYRCRIDYRMSRTRNYVTRLYVVVPPKEVIVMNTNGRRLDKIVGPIDEGSDLSLICEAYGKPQPSITWWTSDESLLDDSYFVAAHGYSRNELHLYALNRSSLMLELICRASNTNITVPLEATIFIDLNLRPLDVKIVAPQKKISSGVRATFECRSSGSRPRPLINWWIGTIKMSDVHESISKDGNQTSSVLSFVPGVEDNGKHISCRVENPAIDASAIEDRIQLIVYYVPQLHLALGPNINGDFVKEGSDVYLECHILANPWVYEVAWLFEGIQLTNDVTKGIIIANQSLVLQKVRRHLRGSYECYAINEEGRGASNTLFLRVQFSPVCKSIQKVPFAVARNELTHIVCDVESDPTNVSFKWFLNNSSETIEIRSFVVNGTKSVVSYSPRTRFGYGSLYCWAHNEIGKQLEPCIFHIIRAGPPSSVKNCVVSNHSMSSMILECVAGDSGGLQQSFHVEVYAKQTGKLLLNLTETQRPVFALTNLPLGTTFNLNVYAHNSKGKSMSTAINGATLGPPERQTSQTSADDSYFGQQMVVWLIVICALILIITLVTLVVFKIISDKNSTNNKAHKRDDESECDKIRNKNDFLEVDESVKANKCQVICTSNDEGFVSIEYKTNAWPSHMHRPETVLVSTPYKPRSIENQYSTSSSVLYPQSNTVEVIEYETNPQLLEEFKAANLYCDYNPTTANVTNTKHQLTRFGQIPVRESPIADGCSESETNEYPFIHTVNYPVNNL